MYGIHIFGHEVFTSTIGVLGVLTVKIRGIDKGAGIGGLETERLRRKIDKGDSWRQSGDAHVVATELTVVAQAGIEDELGGEVVLGLEEGGDAFFGSYIQLIGGLGRGGDDDAAVVFAEEKLVDGDAIVFKLGSGKHVATGGTEFVGGGDPGYGTEGVFFPVIVLIYSMVQACDRTPVFTGHRGSAAIGLEFIGHHGIGNCLVILELIPVGISGQIDGGLAERAVIG